jgi:8-oxo-dGTP diphosphatase
VAACREAKEEVGVTVMPDDLQLVHTMHEMAEGHERMNLGFEVARYSGKLKNMEPNKCDELRWSLLTELPENTVEQVKEIFKNVSAGKVYSDYNF